MNSDDLALFAAVVHAGSISRAAIEKGMDQSTVSRRVSLLESEVGGRLFHRSGRGVTLTERGQQLMVYAQTISNTLETALRAMQKETGTGPARLRIGAQPTIARMTFGKLYHAFRVQYPNTQIRFIEGLANQLLSSLNDGEIDLLLLYRPEHAGSLPYDPLLHEGIWLITPPDFTLPVANSVPLSQLADIPLILPSTHHGIRLMAETAAARHGFSLKLALECDGSTTMTKQLVMDGCGCTILPLAAVIDDVNAGRLKTYRLTEPGISRCVALLMGKTPRDASETWQINQIIRQTVTELVQNRLWPDTELDAALHSGPLPVTPPAA